MLALWRKRRKAKKGVLDVDRRLWMDGYTKTRRSVCALNDANPSCMKNYEYETDGSTSEDMRGSKASTCVDSIAEHTVTTSACSSKLKTVRFDIVEIREYERIASDNPCCSSGPPIGIGWSYGETRKINMEDYEYKRGRQRFYMDIILSRREREELLLEWGESMSTIAASTRAATKAKFQRKQTVVNTRKYLRFEKAITVVSRRFKRALEPTMRMEDGTDESLQPTMPESYKTDQSTTERTFDTPEARNTCDLQTNSKELDDDDIEGDISQDVDAGQCAGDCNSNDDFTLGATTLDNNSVISPSIIEIEKFYQELELELFGDDTKLPSMVGQTLEVPQDKISSNMSVVTGYTKMRHEERHEERIPEKHPPSQEVSYMEYHRAESAQNGVGYPSNENYSFANITESTRGPSITGSMAYIHEQLDGNHHYQTPFGQRAHLAVQENDERLPSLYPMGYMNKYNEGSLMAPETFFDSRTSTNPRGTYQTALFPEDRCSLVQNGSYDSFFRFYEDQSNGDFIDRQLRHDAHAYSQPSTPLRVPSWDSGRTTSRHSDPGEVHRFGKSQRQSERARRRQNDGPEIRHIPLPANFSSSQLMDGEDGELVFANTATVTITESSSS